jgi:hypothetical protein
MNHPYPKTLEELHTKIAAGWWPKRVWRVPVEGFGVLEMIMSPEVPKGERARIRGKLYMWENPGASTYRAWKTQLKVYGLTEDDYWRLYEKQNGVCAICGERGKRDKLDVDHCHKTGAVRGLLCNRCNLCIGRFEDNPMYLKSAAEYLCRIRPN